MNDVRELFEQEVPVITTKETIDNKNSGLVYLETIADAIKILSLYKNTKLNGKTLKITFADSQTTLPVSKANFSLRNFSSIQNLDFMDSNPKMHSMADFDFDWNPLTLGIN